MAGHKAAERAAHLAASPSAGKAAAKKKADSGRATRQKWDAEEVRMLEKALTKFPQGTAKRWDQVHSTPVTALTDPTRHGGLEERGLCLTPCCCKARQRDLLTRSKLAMQEPPSGLEDMVTMQETDICRPVGHSANSDSSAHGHRQRVSTACAGGRLCAHQDGGGGAGHGQARPQGGQVWAEPERGHHRQQTPGTVAAGVQPLPAAARHARLGCLCHARQSVHLQ